jgi:hypothetical protein
MELMENLANADGVLPRTYDGSDDVPIHDDVGHRDKEREKLLDAFIQLCLRIAKNDATLHDWFDDVLARRWKFRDPHQILFGDGYCNKVHLFFTDMTCHVNGTPSLRGAGALRDGIEQPRLCGLRVNDVCSSVQETLFEAVALSSTVQDIEITVTKSVNVRALTKHLFPSSQHQSTSTNHVMPKPLISTNHYYCRQLTRLHVTYCRLTDMDVLVLSLGFAHNRSLISLNLGKNHITGVGVMYFCQHWTDDSPLQTLDLSFNWIGTKQATMPSNAPLQQSINGSTTNTGTLKEPRDRAWCSLKDGLQRHPKFRTLIVPCNKMQTTDAIALLQVAAIHPSLDSLDLSLDCSDGTDGLLKVALAIPLTKLKHLSLRWTTFPKGGRTPEMLQQLGQAFLAAVQRNFYLIEFVFFDLRREWMDPIEFFVDLNRTCRPLLTSTDMSASVWPHVLAHYDRNGKISHIYFALREHPWLVYRT